MNAFRGRGMWLWFLTRRARARFGFPDDGEDVWSEDASVEVDRGEGVVGY